MADQTTTHTAKWHLWSAQQCERILKRPLEHRLQIVRMPAFANLTEKDQKAVWASIRIPRPVADGGQPSSPKAVAQLRPRARRPMTFEPASKQAAPRQQWRKGEQALALKRAALRWAAILFGGLALLYMLVEHS